MKYINKENLADFAFLNTDTLKPPLRAVCVCFHGYTDATMFEKSPEMARKLGERGIAWVHPYYSVWAWMSPSSQEFCEQVLDAVYDKLGAESDVPFIVSGGSMGGLTALCYLVYGKRKAIGCALNCPVTDMAKTYEDKPTFRRAILSAHIENADPFETVMKKYSPVHFAYRLPDIPYFFVYGERDEYFTEVQMPPMRAELDKYGLSYKLSVVEGMTHCDIEGHSGILGEYCDFLIACANKE